MQRFEIVPGGEYLCRLKSRERRVCKILRVPKPKDQSRRRTIYALNFRTNREVMLSSEAQVLFPVVRTGEPGKWKKDPLWEDLFNE